MLFLLWWLFVGCLELVRFFVWLFEIYDEKIPSYPKGLGKSCMLKLQ